MKQSSDFFVSGAMEMPMPKVEVDGAGALSFPVPDAQIAALVRQSLEDWCSVRKFGPNYVKFRTPLTNIRITTFVSNETEVKVIDPNKLEVIEAVGCRVREVCI